MIKYIKGDATKPIGDGQKIITHICNNIGGWGRGFVIALSRRWIKPETKYREWYNSQIEFKLGQIQLVKVEESIYVANMIAQDGIYTKNEMPPIRYDALLECLTRVAEVAKINNASIHMPRIGCGLAGGKWDNVESIISHVFTTEQVIVYDI